MELTFVYLNESIWTQTTDGQFSLFSLKSRTFGLGQTNSGAFGVFSAKLSAPILVQWVPFPCFPLFTNRIRICRVPLGTNGTRVHWMVWAHFHRTVHPLHNHSDVLGMPVIQISYLLAILKVCMWFINFSCKRKLMKKIYFRKYFFQCAKPI